MNEGRDVWSGGTSKEKSEAINKSLRTTFRNVFQPGILFPKVVRPTREEVIEKQTADAWEEVQKRREEKNHPFLGNSPALEKTVAPSAGEQSKVVITTQKINKEMVEKVLKDSGFDKLPMTEKARQIVEEAINHGARPVTEYTGKIMMERQVPEEPPAFVRPGKLEVGDRVIPLQWVPVGIWGAKFDLPNVPPSMRVKKMYTGPVKVTKSAYPPWRVPADFSHADSVTEERLWAIDLEEDKNDKTTNKSEDMLPFPLSTRDTTLLLKVDDGSFRLGSMAEPSGEVLNV